MILMYAAAAQVLEKDGSNVKALYRRAQVTNPDGRPLLHERLSKIFRKDLAARADAASQLCLSTPAGLSTAVQGAAHFCWRSVNAAQQAYLALAEYVECEADLTPAEIFLCMRCLLTPLKFVDPIAVPGIPGAGRVRGVRGRHQAGAGGGPEQRGRAPAAEAVQAEGAPRTL